jgi:hypothetical protein
LKQDLGLIEAVEVVFRLMKESPSMEEVRVWRTTSFLQGDQSSAKVQSIALSHPRYFGTYPQITFAMVSLCIKRILINEGLSLNELFDLTETASNRPLLELESRWSALGIKKAKGLSKRAKPKLLRHEFVNDLHWRVYLQLHDLHAFKAFILNPISIRCAYRGNDIQLFTPHVLVQTHEGKKGLVMMYSLEDMARYHIRSQYVALRYFCQVHGLFVGLMDDQLLTMKKIQSETIMNEIVDTFDDMNKTARMFNAYGMKYLQTTLKHHAREEVQAMVSRHLIQTQQTNDGVSGWLVHGYIRFKEDYLIDQLKKLPEFNKMEE